MPTDDTDPTPSNGPNSTDPIFPPKIGKTGPRDVSVTAVQGPGVDPQPPREITTTERLLSGLLDGPAPDVKSKPKMRKAETSGEEAADYSVSPRPLPIGRTEEDVDAVIVAPPSGPRRPGRAELDETRDALKGTREDRTVPLPRKKDRRGLIAFAVALIVCFGVGWILVGRGGDKPTTSTSATATVPVTTMPRQMSDIPPPTDIQADPIIESQPLTKPTPSRPPTPRQTTTAAPPTASAAPPASAPTATTTTAAPTATGAVPPDFDELKKGIKH